MTRILLLTSMYPPHHYGGYELLCRDVVDRWRRRGHTVTVLTSSLRLPGVPEDGPGEAEVHRQLLTSFRPDAPEGLVPASTLRWMLQERANQRHLRQALARTPPEVVSVWHMLGLSLGLLTTLAGTGIPLVYVVCDDWVTYVSSTDPWGRLSAAHPILAGLSGALAGLPWGPAPVGTSGAFCFVSHFTRRRAEQDCPWPLPLTTVLPSGIDGAIFVPRPGPADEWRWRLLFVGRVDQRKGVEVAIRALVHLPPEATLEVVGVGRPDYLAHLSALARSLGVIGRVTFTGAADRSSLAEKYRGADALLFPTVWDEPFGLVPLEAMACHLPVVATGTGGSAEVLSHQANCLLVPPGDDETLAAAVCRLAGDPALRDRLRRSGAATAERFQVGTWAERLEAWHVAASQRFADGLPGSEPSRQW